MSTWSNPQNVSIDLGGQIPELRRSGGAVQQTHGAVVWTPCSRRWIARRRQGSRGTGRHVDFGGAAQQGALRERQRLAMGVESIDSFSGGHFLSDTQCWPQWVGWGISFSR